MTYRASSSHRFQAKMAAVTSFAKCQHFSMSARLIVLSLDFRISLDGMVDAAGFFS